MTRRRKNKVIKNPHGEVLFNLHHIDEIRPLKSGGASLFKWNAQLNKMTKIGELTKDQFSDSRFNSAGSYIKGNWHTNPRRRRNVDYDEAARELYLFIINDSELYVGQAKRIVSNLAKKMANRTFDRAKSVKAFKHLADNGAKKYLWEFGGYSGRRPRYWSQIAGFGYFTPTSRREAAAMLLEHYMDEIQEEADLVAIKPKRRRNAKSQHQALGAHMAFGPAGLQTMQALVPSRRRNAGHIKNFGLNINKLKSPYFMTPAEVRSFEKRMPMDMQVVFSIAFNQLQSKPTGDGAAKIMKIAAKNGHRIDRNMADWMVSYLIQHGGLGVDVVNDERLYLSDDELFQKKSRRRNPRNKKLDIELPNSNLSVVGVGSDINGNKVIRFSYPNKRSFSIQIYNMSIRDMGYEWEKLFYEGKLSSSDKHILETSAVYYIKNYGSAAQKKGLRTYSDHLKRQNPRRRRR